MLMMRLQRVGRKNDPSYRLVVVDKRESVASGNNIDHIGSYNPKLGVIEIDGEKAKHWLSKGVQPSVTVHNMLVSKGIVEGKKKNALSKKSPIVDEEAIKKAKDEAEAKAKKEADEAQAKLDAEAAEAEAKLAAEAAPAEAVETPAEEVAA
jgi:small subunit ribosomal protein S16